MIRLRLAVELVDSERRELDIKPVTQVAFERHWKMGLAALGDNTHMEHLYWLAWDALRRAGEKPAEFDIWLETVVGVATVDETPEVDDDPLAPSSSISAS